MLGVEKRAAATAPETLNQTQLYYEPEPASTISREPKEERQMSKVKELLGETLVRLHWPTVSPYDEVTLLLCVDGLERKLIDLKRGGNTDG